MLNNIMTRFGVLCVVFSMILITCFIFFSDAVTSSSKSALSQSSKVAPQAVTQNYPAAAADEEAPVIQLASLSLDLGPASDLTHATPKDTDSLLTQAKSLAQEKKFAEAMSLLNTVPAADKKTYRVQFYQAKLLSWAGHHAWAEEKFVALNDAYPQNSDVMVSHAFLKMYQKDFAKAEALFSDVLSMYPDYEDARRGLNMAQNAQQ